MIAEDDSCQLFLGTIIACPRIVSLGEPGDIMPSLTADAQCLDIVDGHQRIVTVLSLLEAMCASAIAIKDDILKGLISSLITVLCVDGTRPKRFTYCRTYDDSKNEPKIKACIQWFSDRLADIKPETFSSLVHHLLIKTDVLLYNCEKQTIQASRFI